MASKITAIVFSEEVLNLSKKFETKYVSPDDVTQILRENTLFIVFGDDDLVESIQKHSRNCIVVYLYDKKPKDIGDYSFHVDNFQENRLDLTSLIGKKSRELPVNIDYLKSLGELLNFSKKTLQNHLKVNFLGRGESGRTTFINFLKKGYFEERPPMTNSMEYTEYHDEENTFHLFDMAGQEIFHVSHEIFLNDGDLITVFVTYTHGFDVFEYLKRLKIYIRNKCPSSRIVVLARISHEFYDSYGVYSGNKTEEQFISESKKQITSLGYEYIYFDVRLKIGLEEVKNLLNEEARKKSYLIPSACNTLFEKMKLIDNFIVTENDFYEIIKFIPNKENFINFLTQIGFLRYEMGMFVLGYIRLNDQIKKIITCSACYTNITQNYSFTRNDYRKIWPRESEENYLFLENFLIKYELGFYREGKLYIPILFNDSLDLEILWQNGIDNFLKKNNLEVNFLRFNIKTISKVAFPKLICTFSKHLDFDFLLGNCIKINDENCSYFLMLSGNYLAINITDKSISLFSKILQLLWKKCMNIIELSSIEMDGYKLGPSTIYNAIGQEKEYFNKNFSRLDKSYILRDVSNACALFYNPKLVDGIIQIEHDGDTASLKLDPLNHYVLYEHLFPSGKNLYLVKSVDKTLFKVPFSKGKDINLPWNLAEFLETEIEDSDENFQILTQDQRKALKECLNVDSEQYDYLLINEGNNNDIFEENENFLLIKDFVIREKIAQEAELMIRETVQLDMSFLSDEKLELYEMKLYHVNNQELDDEILSEIEKSLEIYLDPFAFSIYLDRLNTKDVSDAEKKKILERVKRSVEIEIEDELPINVQNMNYYELKSFCQKISKLKKSFYELIYSKGNYFLIKSQFDENKVYIPDDQIILFTQLLEISKYISRNNFEEYLNEIKERNLMTEYTILDMTFAGN